MMERCWLSFSLILCIFHPLCISLDQASFYGNSYISIPLKEAKGSTDIHFKFRTRLPSALLLLVAGSTDYCIVRLDNNRLKVNINLGAGESELLTPRSVILNDFKWHEVFIIRKEANLSIIVDNSHTVKKTLPGKFFELNINYGLFVGGHGNYSDFFFGHLINFRGCLSDVMYNGLYVLDIARRRQSQAIVNGVTWNCASEFAADNDRPISFIEDEAFMIIPHPVEHTLKLQVELKTYLQHSILFYNSGLSKLDLFAVEVWDGKLKVTLKSGNSLIENTNHMTVADGHWHKISLRVTTSSIDLNVNSNMSSVKLPHGHILEFNELFYIGGIEISKRARAMSKGLKTSDGSFKGCLRHLVFGEHKKGFPDVYVSEGLLPGCLWEYPCVHKPCSRDNICVQQGLDSFKCECQKNDCGNHTTKIKVYAKTNLADELELLSLETLEVLEGQNVLITTTNLHVILDYPKYDIKDSGITFNIVDGPTYGSIKNVLWNEKNSFTLLDVSRDKVYYIHDGSEYRKDHVVLEVEFSTGEHFILPSYLQGKFKFTLHINVVPVNDPPVLNIPSTSVLRVAKGTRKLLDSHLLQVTDPDNSAKQLVYNIDETNLGHFEYIHKPGQPVSSFTHKDVESNQIMFVHHDISSTNDSYITLQVSDGVETSALARLRVQTFPQHWRLQNNTGLVLLHETSQVITPFNLSFVSNVVNSTDNAEYHVIQGPQFGNVEVEKNAGHWENSVIFTSEDIRRHRVRYRHINSLPDYDEFQFRTSLNKSVLYIFRMTFAKCELKPLKTAILNLNSMQEATVTNSILEYQTQPIKSPTTSIKYLITRAPMYGFLFSAISKYRMRYHDTFTQEDVASYNIKYKLYRKSYSPVTDVVLFKVMARGCKNVTGNLTISHQPTNDTSSHVKAVFEHLQVTEGGKSSIGTSQLNIKSDLISDLFFNITTLPAYGWLQVIKNGIIRNKTNYFTSTELASNQLFYIHDDSETKSDSFQFMALSREEENFQYVETFRIDILLKNDNSPVRTVEKVFHVVVGGQRLLTNDDLTYSDADLDTQPSDIIYTCRELPNGEVFSAKNTSVKLTEFTQADLNEKGVLFKHKGPEYGKLRLWITDGQFYVNGILEVQASAPFIRVFTNKKLIVKKGSKAVITKEHLSYTTNLYASDDDVIYEITTKPSSGRIVLGDKSESVLHFTQAQINKAEVFYVNEVSTASADEAGIRVRCRDAINVAQLRIWMLPPSYWEPLSLKTCQILSVEESTSALINRAVLEILQPEVPASAITYYISEYPENGYVSILPTFRNSDDETTNIRTFTQAIMNENRVIYIQSVANQTKDRIVFNASNGMVWLNNVILDVQIIPERLYLGTNVLNVYEGGVVLISSVHLFVLTDYYKTRITEYILLELPKHGCVQIQKSCIKAHKFTQKELKAGLIHYAHDGSENLKDEIKLVAVAGQKRSLPIMLSIVILPINDQRPLIVNNTGLIMWEGGTAVISNSMLAAVDGDRPMEILRYQVLGCWWGNVSLLSDATTSLQFFTQELINKNLVAFRHLNGSETKFIFNVSDGLHSTKEHTFFIKTKPVGLKIVSKPLHIFPLQRKYLTSNYILASVSDPDRAINFEVVVAPSLGRLMIETETPGMFKVINSFTQKDLNNSRVFYEHTHPFADLYANDSFLFNVRSYLAQPLLNQKLTIDISVSSGGLDAYVNIPKIKVDEGGIISIPLNLSGVVTFLESHAGLRSPIIHAFAANPQHGDIFLQNNSNLTTFTQQQLESGQVLYQHDHSDSLGDNIYFSLYLIPGYIMLCNITVPIIVEPINDQPFKLVTPAPHLTVVQGENHTITRNELCTEDADTPPRELGYDVISGPKEGFIALFPDMAAITTHFSQADIDDNKLVYVHNGSLLTDTFHLRVWDGKFWPAYIVFNVQVLPISLNASVGAPMFLQQGSNVVLLSENQFVIDTNANRSHVHYSVKKNPKHGVIYVKDALATEFTQNEIANKNVMYMQTDMTTANDSFDIFVGMIRGNTSVGSEVTIIITVQPLMQIGNISAFTGETTRLTLNVLDATPLAKLTSSNPRYNVIQKPRYGEIRKIIRSSGEHKNVLDTAITSFSHEEVQSGLIYFVADDIEVGWNGLLDHLKFVLAASIFQPAVGELKINIRSSLLNEIYSTLAGPNDPAGHEGGIHFASPNMTRDYFLIVSMVAGVVILGVAVIIVIKCRSFEPEELNKEEQCLQPIPLPRPPDRLMASSPPLKHTQDGFASPLLAALPQCKVTPLNKNELEAHARYPYGVDEHADDWSSCDASDPACPSRNNIMLRRNQYWV